MPSPKVTVEDVDAFSDISNGSTISVGSAASRGSARPHQDGSRRSKSVQGRRTKNASKSPYASKQLKTAKPQPLKATSRNLWINAMRNGSASLSTENSPINTWVGSRPPHAKQMKTGTRGRHFSDAVQVSDFKGKGHTRSASMSASEPHVSGGGPAYKPPEDYYDEIIELKKIINALKEENGMLSTKLHRVEQDNVLKDRKIEDLLNPRKQPEDVRRTLTDRKGDTSAIVSSLKQKLHAMERTVKEKETELRELKRDLKMTSLEELEIQSEAYYHEIQRLQLVILEMQQTYTYSEPVRSTGSPRSLGSSGRTRGGGSVQRIQDENRHLIAENQSLKKDLMTAIENTSKNDKKRPLNVDYADMNRTQLLQRIHELEQPQKSQERKQKRHTSEEDEGDSEQESTRRRSSSKEVEGRAELKGTPSQKLSQLREVEGALLEERQKLRSTIVQLKHDRSHYRSVADDLRLQLAALQEEMAKRQGDEPASQLERKKSLNSSTSAKRSSIRRSSAEVRSDDPDKQLLEEFQRKRAAKTLQRQWRRHQDDKQDREAEDMTRAATTLQKNWRKYRQGQNQRSELEEEEAVTEIQAALRAHRMRRQQLDKFEDAPEMTTDDDAVVELQSALRAHLARTKHREETDDETLSVAERRLGQDRERSSWHRKQEDSEDDLELGSSASWSRAKESPFTGLSSKRHSTYREDAALALAQARDESSDSDGVVVGGSVSRKMPDRKPEAEQSDPPWKSQIPSLPEGTRERSDPIGRMSDKTENRRHSAKQDDSLRSVQKFETLSEDSEEEVVISSSKAHPTSSPARFGRGRTSETSPQKTARSAREIADSDEDDDDDVMTAPFRPRRSLDTGAIQRPGLSRSSDAVTSTIPDSSESTRQSLSEKLGFTRKKASISAEQPSRSSRKSSQGNLSRKASTFGGNVEDDDDDSDDDVVVSGFRNKKSASAETNDRRPSLKKPEATERKRGSVVGGLFSSSTPTSSSDRKSSFRRRSILDRSDDDDDDDDDIVVSTSKGKGKASAVKRDSQSSAGLWSNAEKSKESLRKKTSSSSGWGRDVEFEDATQVSRRSRVNSQLDELF